MSRGAWSALGVGVAALIACVVGFPHAPSQFFRTYVVTWLFLWNVALGSLVLLMVHHLTGGAWGLVLRRALEAQMRTLPLVGLLFVPIALGSPYIFPWSSAASKSQPGLQATYFQPEFVWGRAVFYFTGWIAVAWLLSAFSRQEDEQGGTQPAWKSHAISGPGLVLYGVTLHFAAIDWMMSIEPSFTSTIFGPVVAASQLVSAFALACIAFAPTARHADFEQIVSGKVLIDVGNLMLTLVVTWSYLVWCQFMLIWIGDLPSDNIWWLARNRGIWKFAGGVIVLFHFGVPVFLLLFRAVKRNSRSLACVASLLLTMQFVFVNYQVRPSFQRQPLSALGTELLLPIGLGGLWLADFLWLFGRRPIVPLLDRNREQARRLWLSEQAEAAREEVLVNGNAPITVE